MSRYLTTRKANNKDDLYKETFDDKGVTKILQFRTPKFKQLDQGTIDKTPHDKYIWKFGDSFWRLADKYYGSAKHWWVIAAFNKKPTEAHINLGEEIRIPISLADALQVV